MWDCERKKRKQLIDQRGEERETRADRSDGDRETCCCHSAQLAVVSKALAITRFTSINTQVY